MNYEKNYEEKYKEALERAKKWLYAPNSDKIPTYANRIIEGIFPELKESKAEWVEKIRKELKDYLGKRPLKKLSESDAVNQWIDWLEKQGKVNDYSLTMEDEKIRKELLEHCINRRDGKQICVDANDYRRWAAWIEKQGNSPIKWNKNTKDNKPQKNHSVLMQTTHGIAEGEWQGEHWHQYRWAALVRDTDVLSWMELSDLEKQSEQSHWKPTEEQLQTIHAQLNEGAVTYPEDKRVLTTLYEDLMKITTQEEKQVEQKETLCDKCRKEQPSHSCQDITALGRCYIEGMNTSNKVKPKFKVGDWIYHNKVGVYPILITDYDEELGYQTECLSTKTYFRQEFVEKEYHLWTIQDAKDGDVLICGNQTFLFKCIEEKQVYCYGYIWRNEYKELIGFQFCNQPNQIYCYTDAVMSPATKEQRDTLFAMMTEAGYEWDADKKELKKIEQNLD